MVTDRELAMEPAAFGRLAKNNPERKGGQSNDQGVTLTQSPCE